MSPAAVIPSEPEESIMALRHTLMPPAGQEIRYGPIRNDEELAAVLASDREAYGEEALSETRLREWLAGYPNGALIAWDGPRVVGSVGLWPLSGAAYKGLRDGSLGEGDIGPELFPAVGNGAPCAHWTLAAVYVHPSHRGGTLLPDMLGRAFAGLANSGHAADPISVLGLAFSDAGARTMGRLGFVPSTEPTQSSMPPYELHLGKAGLAAMPKRISTAYARRSAPGTMAPAVSVPL